MVIKITQIELNELKLYINNNICYGYIYNYSQVNSIHREEERCKQRSFPLYTIS